MYDFNGSKKVEKEMEEIKAITIGEKYDRK